MSNDDSYYSKSSTFVRYLFDGQLFNVPNNYKQYGYLITYLKHERIFGESYLVTVNDGKKFRGLRRSAAMEEENLFGGNKRRRFQPPQNYDAVEDERHYLSTRSRSWQNCRSDDERCNMMMNRLVADSSEQSTITAADADRFKFSGFPIKQPTDQLDVRDLMTSIELHGGPTEWLDLKLTLRLPSIIIYLKLQGSNTIIPNADYTCRVTMQNLQVLQGPRTIGEKLAMVLASLRKKFFNEPLPDFKRLTILQESGAYDLSDPEDEDQAAAVTPSDSAYHDFRARQPEPEPDYTADEFPMLEIGENREKRERAQQEELIRQQNRMAFGSGTVKRVLIVSDQS